MTTPNLEQIAANAPVSSPEDSINRVVTWMTGRLMQEHDRNTTLSILRRKLEEHYERLACLRTVAPQPAKTEEVRRAIRGCLHGLTPQEELVNRIALALTPYLVADREPHPDSVRLVELSDTWDKRADKLLEMRDEANPLDGKTRTRLEEKAWVNRYCATELRQALLDASASANEGRARG